MAPLSLKSQGTIGGTSGDWKSEIIKGTGRFEGIKRTQSAKAKYLPLEKEEAGQKGYKTSTPTKRRYIFLPPLLDRQD